MYTSRTPLILALFATLSLSACASDPPPPDAHDNTPETTTLFESDPPGASLYVDGYFQDRTPASITLPTSKQRVELRIEKPGHQPARDSLTRPPNQPWQSNYWISLQPNE